jgi:hypothetical protein
MMNKMILVYAPDQQNPICRAIKNVTELFEPEKVTFSYRAADAKSGEYSLIIDTGGLIHARSIEDTLQNMPLEIKPEVRNITDPLVAFQEIVGYVTEHYKI